MRKLGAVALVLLSACETNNHHIIVSDLSATSGNSDAGVVNPLACTAGQKECINDRLGRVCPSDGAQWISFQCGAGEKCASGDCVPDLSKCTPGDGACLDATHGLRCKSDGSGFTMVDCTQFANTTCAGPGLCQGSCIVGSSLCVDPGHVATCADGQSFTNSNCDAGSSQFCVDTTTDPALPQAACVTSSCAPTTSGCDTVCGNKNDSGADQTKFTSTCTATPQGYKYLAVGCAEPKTCDPQGATCAGDSALMAGCASDCTPGEMRCASGGTQTCDASGHWPNTASACPANTLCMQSPSDPTKAVCGDPACAVGAAGACPETIDNAGGSTAQFRACGSDGKLGAAANCPGNQVCVPLNAIPPLHQDPLNPAGACTSLCQDGDQQCSGLNAVQVCSGGRWSAPTTCDNDTTCLGYTSKATGRPQAVCGAICVPGSHQCTNFDGGVDDGDQAQLNDSYIQTCNADGLGWGPAQACQVGTCTSIFGDAECLAQCIPGQTVCLGDFISLDGLPNFPGTDYQGTCTPMGRLPVIGLDPTPQPTACPDGTMCRHLSSGKAIGCVECVGGDGAGHVAKNEFGFVDTRCVQSTGDPAGGPLKAIETCNTDNTWVTPAPCADVNTNYDTCLPPTANPIPSRRDAYCHTCDNNFSGFSNGICTNSALMDSSNGTSCLNEDIGTAMPCGGLVAGDPDVPDCCASYCFVDPVPEQAQCNSFLPGPALFIDACQQAGMTRVLQNVDDDTTEILRPLPFPLTFFGRTYTTFDPMADGVVLLGSEINEDQYDVASLPSVDEARAAIFPFHRDLFLRDAGLCYATVGTAPNRKFVITTEDGFIYNDQSTHLTFDVILNESDGSMDFVYQTMIGANTDGSDSVVGVQDFTGTRAIVYEDRDPGTLFSGLSLHLGQVK